MPFVDKLIINSCKYAFVLMSIPTVGSSINNISVPAANHFVLEINHFNKVINSDIAPKLSYEDAFWNAKTLESIQQSIQEDSWVNL